MNKFKQLVRRAPKRTSALIAMIAAVIIVPASLYAWGPSRTTFTIEKPADYVTFNSIVDNPNIGDERNFVGIRENGTNNKWTDNMQVQPGKEYTVRMYVHNNAAKNLNKVAKDVTAKFDLPTKTAKSIEVNGFLSASNAKPKQVWDNAKFSSNQDFNLAYKSGTLKYYNNANGSGFTVPESVFTNSGAKLGYDKMDGNIPGCFQYAGYLTFVVKPQFAEKINFTMSKKVSKHGANKWVDSYNAKPGEVVDYLVQYKNTGSKQQNNVTIRDTLPKGQSYVKGSTTFGNSQHPNGTKASDNIATSQGVNIGSYAAGSNAWAIFSAKIADNGDLEKCGTNVMTNTAKVTTEGYSKSDSAKVNVEKDCPTPKPVYKCDSLQAKKIATNKYRFNGSATAKSGAEVVKYTLSFGDGTTYTGTNLKDVDHSYPGDGKSYTAKLSVTVKVGNTTRTVTGSACEVTIKTTKPPVTKDIQVCELTTHKIVTIKEDQFDSTKHSLNLDDCKSKPVEKIKVCELATKKIVTIKKDDFDSSKYSRNLNDCKPKPVVKIEVCELETHNIVKINKDDFDSERYSKDLSDCKTTPEQPEQPTPGNPEQPTPETPKTPETPSQPEQPATELPQTGMSNTVGGVIGVGTLIGAISYFVASRRSL